MIVDMMKYTILMPYWDTKFHYEIENLGVVHIVTKDVDDEDIQSLVRRKQDVEKLLMQLSNMTPTDPMILDSVPFSGTESACYDAVVDALARREALQAKSSAIERELERYVPWGGESFDDEMFGKLGDAGVKTTFCQCPTRAFKQEWCSEGAVEIISEEGGTTYFVVFSTDSFPLPEMDAEVVELPKVGAKQLRDELAEVKRSLDEATRDTDICILYRQSNLRTYLGQLTWDIQHRLSERSADEVVDGKVHIIQGFVPEDSVEKMDSYLNDNPLLVYIKEKATPEDCPPVKLKNNSFAKLFEPITELFSLPNYSEIDPTPLFAPFFMLFFGLCLGDAGYGLLVLIAAIWAKSKMGKEMQGYCNLGIVLGAATVVVSLVTGMAFGVDLSTVEWIPENIRGLFITDTNFSVAGYSPMMVVAVVLGLIQIMFGMCVNAAKLTKQHGTRYAVSTISWIVVLPVLAITFGLPAVGVEFPTWVLYALYAVIGASVIGIFFFNSPKSGILMNIGSGLWTTYNMASGLLSDALSYIRLFALGLTGGILGGVFNTMAFQAGEGLPLIAQIIVVGLILLIGHSINIGLCLIGAFVHPMRLTFVEFYKNSGFEGGGKQYKPVHSLDYFKQTTKE